MIFHATISFRVATQSDLDAALALRRKVYHQELGRIPDDEQDATGHHLIALDDGSEVVAGLRLLGAGLRPFDFEHVLDLSSLVGVGRNPAMIGRLFIREDWRSARRSPYLLAGLLDLAIRFATAHSITDYYLYTFAHLLHFYRRAHFSSLGLTIYHPHWRLLYLMHMDTVRFATSRRPIV